MFVALHPVDYALVILLLGVLIAVGIAVRRPRTNGAEFWFADRNFSAWLTGLSLSATLLPGVGIAGSMLAGISLIGLPGWAYDVGFTPLLIVAALWLAVPLVWRYVLPLYHGLELKSAYTYLELRFDRRTRMLASAVFFLWRMTWIAGVLAFGCQLLVVAVGLRMPSWLLITVLGAVTTSYTSLGGLKAAVSADAIHLVVMSCAVVVLLVSLWIAVDGGAVTIWNVAESLQRIRVFPPLSDREGLWSHAGILPQATFCWLAFFVADQVIMQRLLAVKNLKVARQTLVFGGVVLTIAMLTLTYLGLGLLAFYHEHPAALRTKWVVNVDPATRRPFASGEPAGDAGIGPALDWEDPEARIDAAHIHALVAQRRIIRPNSRDAIEDAEPLLDPGAVEGLRVQRLLTRYPPRAGSPRGEAVLHTRANGELLPWYLVTQLPWGLVGLGIAAILAAIMSSMDAGLIALSEMVANRSHSAGVDQARSEASGRAASVTVAVMGITATGFAICLTAVADFVHGVLLVTGVLGGPLFATFCLGILSRRANPIGAMVGLIVGIVLTAWLTAAAVAGSVWSVAQPTGAGWAFSCGVLLTVVSSYLASLVCGPGKSATELRGLVWGQGQLGQRENEATPKIILPKSRRWR